jgi:hypothetical protein
MNQFSVDVGESVEAPNKYTSSQTNLTGACPPLVSCPNSEGVALRSWAPPWGAFGSLSQHILAQGAKADALCRSIIAAKRP